MLENEKSKVLIVDDESANIFLLEGLLTAEGFITLTASSGQECLDILQESKPDVILLDIMMPELNGLEVLEKILANEETKHIPVILVTAKAESEDVEKGLQAGAVEYIKKPIDEVELLARLRTSLRIKQQEDKLREMLNSKNEFIRIISHDIRTPFASITGLAELLYNDPELDKKLDNDQKDSLKYIIESSQFTVNYFNRLLSWSSLGSKEIELQRKDVTLAKVVNTALVIYQSKMDQKNISFTSDFDEDLTLNIDETYFSQVINNLLNNAIKYTPEGGNIKISAEKTDKGIAIQIIDSGVGIENITPEELFNKSVNKSTRGTQGEKGTGIGLTICKKIIDSHGFKITFESTPSVGTKFIIYYN